MLTGFMGTGKSTVGALVAQRLGWDVCDTDEIITERHGPIADIFAAAGEEAFRAHEHEVAAELSERRHVVVNTGGRLMLNHENSRQLGVDDAAVAAGAGATGGTRVFCLTADVEEIVRRLSVSDGGRGRPLLLDLGATPAEQKVGIRSFLRRREIGYGRFEQMPTDGLTPEQVAEEI
ncbi:MAG TPA: hypothetical protein DEP69_00375, partial [Acidimicrobiaceae bacterium]|nr:hypothetical protein [Acidimicrobiaceae bacterium]